MTTGTKRTAAVAGLAAMVAGLAIVGGVVLPATAVEIAVDDFRVSSMGPDGVIGYEAQQPKVAYSPESDQYLVVWRGDHEGDGQAEIYGQLVDARTSADVNAEFVVARIGTAGDASTDAIEPAVVWSATQQEFVVVFTGDPDDRDADQIVSDSFEIYAERVTVAGVPAGAPLRISSMGADDTSASFDANFADVAWNSADDELLVVWQGDNTTNNETEVWGQRLGYSGGNLVEVGTDDFRISQVGTDGATATDGRAPAVAYNPLDNQYFVAWEGNYSAADVGNFEVRGTLVSAAGSVAGLAGTALNSGLTSDEAYQPDVAANPATGDFAVVWMGDNGADEFEIYRQLVGSDGALSGTTAVISAHGPAGNISFLAANPAITFDALQSQYVAVWSGDATTNDQYDVYLRRLSSGGTALDAAARISTMNNGTTNTSAGLADVVYTEDALGSVGTVWQGEHRTKTAVGEGEIWGQFDAPIGDLAVAITVLSDTSPVPGAAVSYRVDVTNNGPATVTGVTASSTVGTGFLSPSAAPGTFAGSTVDWQIGPLAPAASTSFQIDGTVDSALVNGDVVSFSAAVGRTSLIVDTPTANSAATGEVVVDTPPSVTIAPAPGQNDPTNANPVTFRVTFSEPVTGFIADDVVLAASTVGGTLSATASGVTTDLVYDIAVSGADGVGDVVASMPAGVAVDQDGDPEANLAAPAPATVAFDNVPPEVTIERGAAQDDPTNASPIVFDVVFSEPVSGFDAADVDLTGSTVGGTPLAAVSSISSTAYTVSVTGMNGTGDVVATVNAGGASDPAGNVNLASSSTDNEVGFDNVPPTVAITVAIGQSTPTNDEPVVFDVVFSEPVTGFAAGDVDLTASDVDGTLAVVVAGSGTTYTVSVTGMSGDGDVIASIPAGGAADAVGNTNLASPADAVVTFDEVAPSVTLEQAAAQADPTNTGPIVFDVVFSEPVTGLASDDIDLTGSSVGGTLVPAIAGSGTTYTVTVTGMTGTGDVVADVVAGAATDAAGNPSDASTSTDNTARFDTTAPTVTIEQASGQPDPTNVASVEFTVTFSEPVVGFADGDVELSGTAGGALTPAVTGTGPTFTVTVSGLTSSGTVIATLSASAAADLAGNPSAASTSSDNTISFDNVAPTVTIDQALGQADPTSAAPIEFTAVFSEPVTGFGAADVDFAGSTVGGTLTAVVTGAGDTYSVSVSGMTGTGQVVASVVASAASDAAGNDSGASTSTDNTVMFDGDIPSVTIDQAAGQADPVAAGPIEFAVVFSEAVTGFDETDIVFAGSTVSGTLAAAVAGSGDAYTVSVSGMTGTGDVVVSIPAAAAVDTAANPNSASTSTDNTVALDADAPSVMIDRAAAQADPTNASPILFSVVFSEPVDGFAAGDVVLTDSTTGGALTATVSGSGASYTVSVSGMAAPGDVVASIAAGAASDLIGNPSTASTSADNSVGFDADPPAVTVEQASPLTEPTDAASIVFDVAFSEPVTGFAAGDVSFAGSTVAGTLAAAVSGSGQAYEISVTGMSGAGDVVVSVPGGAAVDAAGNASTASTSTDNTVTFIESLTVSTPGGAVTVRIVGSGQLLALAAGDPAVPPPAGYEFPFGQLSFSASGAAGGLVTFELVLPSDVDTYFKLGGVDWSEFAWDGTTGAQVVDGSTVLVTIRDNGRGDADPTAGAFADPGAPAVALAIPTTTTTTVPTTTATPTTASPTTTAGPSAPTTPPGGALPTTGSSAQPIVTFAALAMLGGVVLVGAVSRRSVRARR
jgi:hypothetical protein